MTSPSHALREHPVVVSAEIARDYSAPVELAAQSPPLARKRTLSASIPPEAAGMRLDLAVAQLFGAYSRSRLQQWIKAGRVTVDGRHLQPRDKVWGGERVEITADAEGAGEHPDVAQANPLDVVFEDASLLVIDKPAGLVVHPGSGNREGTLLNALLHHAPALQALPRAGIVHRLDKDTSGLLVVAKTLEAQTSLVRQLQARSVKRDYLALSLGSPPATGSVHAPIGRHPTARTRMAVVASGRAATTHYRTLRRGNGWALLECSLETGRTHQIRVHLHSIGHPLIGDPVYGTRSARPGLPAAARAFPRQALHAARLALNHPATGERLSWESALPDDMAQLLAELERDAPAR
jgi:23S rRNA pseudouridine1911/1915/1917 synthase